MVAIPVARGSKDPGEVVNRPWRSRRLVVNRSWRFTSTSPPAACAASPARRGRARTNCCVLAPSRRSGSASCWSASTPWPRSTGLRARPPRWPGGSASAGTAVCRTHRGSRCCPERWAVLDKKDRSFCAVLRRRERGSDLVAANRMRAETGASWRSTAAGACCASSLNSLRPSLPGWALLSRRSREPLPTGASRRRAGRPVAARRRYEPVVAARPSGSALPRLPSATGRPP